MWLTEEYIRATKHMREEEIQRLQLVSEARKQAPQSRNEGRNARTWRWHVEPGMEDAFQDLLGWMLPSQRNAGTETAHSPPPPGSLTKGEPHPAPDKEPMAA
jgi:hypothetical protein